MIFLLTVTLVLLLEIVALESQIKSLFSMVITYIKFTLTTLKFIHSTNNVFSAAVPRFRNSIAGPVTNTCRSTKRPQSVISMSSVSSSSTSSGGSGGNVPSTTNIMNLSYETCDSPKTYHRSGTLNSQCSIGNYEVTFLLVHCNVNFFYYLMLKLLKHSQL